MKKLRVYLDNCSFNRPFDEQEQILIELETIAKLEIQRLIKQGNFELIWSFMLDKENHDNPHDNRKEHILTWKKISSLVIKENSIEITKKARELENISIKAKDSAHLAVAIISNCDYFITTDKKLINKNIDEIKIINPINFIEREVNNDETKTK